MHIHLCVIARQHSTRACRVTSGMYSTLPQYSSNRQKCAVLYTLFVLVDTTDTDTDMYSDTIYAGLCRDMYRLFVVSTGRTNQNVTVDVKVTETDCA